MFTRRFKRRTAILGGVALLVILFAGVMLMRTRRTTSPAQVPFSDLLRHLDSGSVAAVVVNGDTLDFTLASGPSYRAIAPANYVTGSSSFIPELARRHVRIDVQTLPEQSAYSLGAIALGLGFIGALGFMMYRVTSGRIPALESKTREADAETTTVTFADVAGVDEAKEEVK